MDTETDPRVWQSWQRSWDRQQEWYLPDREERFRVMIDLVEALAGPEPRVLDLACGTGSITERVLQRLPGATVTAVDLDPVLLTMARGYFADEERVRFHTVDLTSATWPERLPHQRYDAVLTATALHWLKTDTLRTLYGQLADVLREGGVFMNADHMPEESAPRLNAAAHAHESRRREREREEGRLDWAGWWSQVAADPLLADAVAERFALFGNPANGDHSGGEVQPAAWHIETLRGAGFAEARQVWCSVPDAVVAALR